MLIMSFPKKECTGGGCFLFDKNLNTILVYSKKKNSVSAPKGRKEKGESLEDCVYREVFEETGIKKEDIIRIPEVLLTEPIGKSIMVGYYVGIVDTVKSFSFDKNELEHVAWYKYDQVCELLHQNRLRLYKDAFTHAQKFLTATQN